MALTRVGEQLVLEVFEQLVCARAPWGGLSPRVLTSGYKRFTLKAQAKKSMRDLISLGQLDLWLPDEKAPRVVYRGAPLLLEILERP